VSDQRPAPVVAELGRPETPQERADRTAEASRLRRQRQTARNLVYSLLVCVALVAVIVLAVPRPQAPIRAAVDYRAAASQYTDTAGQPLVAPVVPSSWKANAAELRGSGTDSSWYIGFVTPGGFAAMNEGIPGDSGLLSSVLDQARPTGTTEVGGLRWRVYDRRALGQDAGNVAYGLSTKIGDTVLAVYGTPGATQVRALATAVAADAASRGLHGANTLP
jgi:hypothetical protein